MEQELASIAKFILNAVGSNVYPYYRELPEDFRVPAVYFPVPDITTGNDTFDTYRADYLWLVTFTCSNQQDAYQLGLTALTAIKKSRNLVPLLNASGNQIGKRYFRLDSPQLKAADGNTVTLKLRFTIRKSYDEKRGEKVMFFNVDKFLK